MRIQILTAGLYALLLSACGFHLKGTQDNPTLPTLALIFTQTDPLIEHEITRTLQQHSINLAPPSQTSLHLHISTPKPQRYQNAIGGLNGNYHEIELIDSLSIHITQDDTPIAQTILQSRTNISYDTTHYLASQAEEQQSHKQLAQDNAQKLLRYLQATLPKTLDDPTQQQP